MATKAAAPSAADRQPARHESRHRSLREIMEEDEGEGEGEEVEEEEEEDESWAEPRRVKEIENERLVRLLHRALAASNVAAVRSMMAEEVEWEFHGAPRHQHLRRLLTGQRSLRSLPLLAPTRMTALGDIVLVEGYGPNRHTLWVHIWTVKDGRLVQLREYWDIGVLVRLPSLFCCWHSRLWNPHLSTAGLILTI